MAHSVRRKFREKFVRAGPNDSCWRLNAKLFDHTAGPYVASWDGREETWRVWSSAGTAAYCGTEEEAIAEMRRLAEIWNETSVRKVYFIGPGCRLGERVKIGIAYEPKKRLSNLQTASHEPLQILAAYPGGKPEEARLHRKFRRSRLSGEWFRITPALKLVIEQAMTDSPKPCLYPDSGDACGSA